MQILLILLLIPFLFIQFSHVSAIEMESPNYRLEIESVEEEATSSANIPAEPEEPRVISENLYNQFQTNGFVVLTDEYDENKEITLNLSKTAVSFENANQDLAKDELTLSVTSATAFGYETKLIKRKSIFHTSTQDTIPQTVCDNGKKCTPRVAQMWTQEASYGIGYHIQGHDSPIDFNKDTYFRPFPEAEQITIMENIHTTDVRESKIKLKINPNPTQPEGTYEGIYEIRMIPSL